MLQHSQPSKEKKVIVEFDNPEALKLTREGHLAEGDAWLQHAEA